MGTGGHAVIGTRPPVLHTGQTYGYLRVGFLTEPWSGIDSLYAVKYTCCGTCTQLSHQQIQWQKKKPAKQCQACHRQARGQLTPGAARANSPTTPLAVFNPDGERRARAARIAAARAATEERIRRIQQGLLPTPRGAAARG